MSWFPQSKDHLPLTWWKGNAIYLSAYIAIVGVASMIVTALLGRGIMGVLEFSYVGLVGQFRVWTPLTYILVNPFDLFLLLSAYIFWKFGEDLEKFFGRRAFIRLFLLLVLVTPVVLTVFGLLGFGTWAAMGISGVFFGVFIAFATLYPRAQISLFIVTVPAGVLAMFYVGIMAVIHLAARNLPAFIMLACQVLAAYGFVRFHQGRWSLEALQSKLHAPKPAKSQRESDLTVLPPYRKDKAETERGHRSEAEKVDAILEKISQKGMQSLTAAERKLLEKASDRLKKG
ncbi:rhomboid family intramembrane serine protease [Roseimicrobium sp. ORNL1]|uniref:rhomboid family intramembrane serine protease n=1 Tax=Roseimicrobium sp. ORNL1 TaxID=2711231 RepID=UPI0013E125AE|nr:rhomboid family intramembrane serine protease [Roseimicrobium sp. ORNL1]QIF05506.1 rhomboid family intramembrane serine protease [Roseimicrobium sp. ORNL1]